MPSASRMRCGRSGSLTELVPGGVRQSPAQKWSRRNSPDQVSRRARQEIRRRDSAEEVSRRQPGCPSEPDIQRVDVGAFAAHRQCPGPPRHDPTRLAISAVSTEQRTGAVVPGPHCRSPCRHAQNDDRRAGTQAAHRTLALCHHRRDTGGRRLTPSRLKGLTGTSRPLSTISARAGFSRAAELRIRGGGNRKTNMALMPTERMGPPPGASRRCA